MNADQVGRIIAGLSDTAPDFAIYLTEFPFGDILHDQRRYRYRLIGSHIVIATGENRTGRFFDEFRFFRDHPSVIPQYETVVKTRRPLYSQEPFTNFISESNYEPDCLMLPLSAGGQFVDTVLVLFQFNSGPFAARLPRSSAKTMALAISWARIRSASRSPL